MALTVEQGTFTKTTSTSTPVSQQVNLVNSSLVPKALILWTNGSTSTNGTYSENIQWSYGFSDGTNHISQNMTALDNVTTQNEAYSWNTNAIISIASTAATPVEVSRATVSAFGTGSFTLSWGTQTDTTAMLIHYIVIGGSDITNVSAFSTTYGSIALGNRSFNGSGTSFTPDFCLTMSGCPNVTTANTLSVGGDNAQLCIGAARSTTERFALAGRTETIGTSDTSMTFANNSCVMSLDTGNGSPVGNADFVSFNNAAGGGITLNVTVAPWATGCFLGFLMIKGGTWETGTFQQRSGTGTQDVSFSNTGLNPEIVFLGGINSATANATVVNNYICLGASDGTRQSFAWSGDQDAQANMINTRTSSTAKIYRQATPNVTATSSTTNAECGINDMATAGKFQLNWTTADTTLRQLAFWTVGTAGQNLTRTISESLTISHTTGAIRGLIQTQSHSLTLAESIPRLRLLLQTNSDSVTLTDGSPVNLRGFNQTSSDSLSISDAESRLRGRVRLRADSLSFVEDIAKDMIDRVRLMSHSLTLSDSHSRLRLLLQTSSDSLGLSEAITRLRNKIKIPNQDVLYFLRFDVGLDDWVEGLDILRSTGRIRTITSESIGVSESMGRLRGRARTLSESVGFSHGLSRITTRLKTISDTLSLASDTVRTRMKTGLISESLGLSESINKLTTRLRSISQSLTLSDAVLSLRGLTRTGPSDSISFSENIQKVRNKIRSISDSLTLTSSIETLRTKLRLLNQSLNLSDNLVYQTSRLRGFTQNLNLSEVIETGGANLVKSISETLDFSESISRSTTRLRTISESFAVTEGGFSRLKGRLKSISDSLGLTDDVSRSLEFVKTITDSVSFTSSHTRLTTRLRTISNSLSLSDSSTNVKSRIRTIQQSLSLSSSIVQDALSSIIKTISEEISFSDGAQRTLGVLKTISQSLNITSDVQKSRPHLIKTISQTLNLTDSESRLRLLVIRGFNQNIAFSSTVIRTVKSSIKQFIIKIRRFKTFRYG